MEAYQTRVVEEKAALDEKIEKLKAFLVTERFCALDEAEQERMNLQLAVMLEYSGILAGRIACFK